MEALQQPLFTKRYGAVCDEKAEGATYTPKILADFVARKMVEAMGGNQSERSLRILDPALGHGELLISLLEHLKINPGIRVEVHGFETNHDALATATDRISGRFPQIPLHCQSDNFLDFILEHSGTGDHDGLFQEDVPDGYDLIIANPPYVRTQIMGASQTQLLARQFGLSGRIDLYHAFILGISRVLKPQGVAGLITSNRFMTTRAGASVRQALLERFNIRQVWDLGDTKLFGAAVLPAVLLVEGRGAHRAGAPEFTSIYETVEPASTATANPVTALDNEGIMETDDGRHFHVQHGKLSTNGVSNGVWRIATDAIDTWLEKVDARSWGTFRDIGKIRVGVKTCADKVFIRSDWQDMPESERPELLRSLVTHHVARRFKPVTPERPTRILYAHEVVRGRRCAVNLAHHPRSRAYLEKHRSTLENREYVIKAGRQWYEIWVPQDPNAWNQPKLVFRDIAEKPTFWIDWDNSIVNGDCYWLACQDPAQTDLLLLAAAVGNSTFIERFYDVKFHNKLYAGRRRFITQYVEQFPLPDPHDTLGKAIIAKTKLLCDGLPSHQVDQIQNDLDTMVWKALTGDGPPACLESDMSFIEALSRVSSSRVGIQSSGSPASIGS